MNNKSIYSNFSKENYLIKVQTFNQIAKNYSFASKDDKSMNFDKQIEKQKYLFLFLGYLVATIIYYIIINALQIENNEIISLGSVVFYFILISNRFYGKFLVSLKKKYCMIVLGFNYQH